MHVATLSPAPVRLADYKPSLTQAAPAAPKISPGVEGILSLIASSTSLSSAEKKSFIQDLADITKFAGNDPKLLMKLLKAIMALIASRPPHQYPQDKLSDVEAQYQADLGDTAAPAANRGDAVSSNAVDLKA